MSSFVGTAVPHRFAARRRGAQLHHVHARADLAAHGPGRDAKACKHLSLALGRSTAVAAHGRGDEGRSALGLDVVDDGLGDDVTVANASATSRNGDLHTRLDLFVKLGLGELAIHDRRYVLGSDGLARERLARIEHLRNLDILEESRDISTLDDLHDALLFFATNSPNMAACRSAPSGNGTTIRYPYSVAQQGVRLWYADHRLGLVCGLLCPAGHGLKGAAP